MDHLDGALSSENARLGPKYIDNAMQQLKMLFDEHESVDLDTFKQVLGEADAYTDRVFLYFLRNIGETDTKETENHGIEETENSGIDVESAESMPSSLLLSRIEGLLKSTWDGHARFIFFLHDEDANGHICHAELSRMLERSIEDSRMRVDEAVFQDLVDTLYAEMGGPETVGGVSFSRFKATLKDNPLLLENVPLSAVSWLQKAISGADSSVQPHVLNPQSTLRQLKEAEKQEELRKESLISYRPQWYLRFKRYVTKHPNRFYPLCIWLAITLGLMIYQGHNYYQQGAVWWYIISRACGMALNFNCAFILIPVQRGVLTLVRQTSIATLLPIDQSVDAHKLIGVTIFILGWVHSICHICNVVFVITQQDGKDLTVWDYLFTTKGETGWVNGSSYITGVVAILILTIMTCAALNCVRQRGYFELFYFTHTLYLPWLVVMIIHGPIFYKFLALPAALLITEYAMRWHSGGVNGIKTTISEATALPSGVTMLRIRRPPLWTFRPGEYVYIRIPSLARFEWHPFTISSAPEDHRHFTVHIRSLGNWTQALYKMVHEKNHRTNTAVMPVTGGKRVTAEVRQRRNDVRKRIPTAAERSPSVSTVEDEDAMVVYLDGPYGAPASSIFLAEHAGTYIFLMFCFCFFFCVAFRPVCFPWLSYPLAPNFSFFLPLISLCLSHSRSFLYLPHYPLSPNL